MARGKRSPDAANPSRKCDGWPKQSPGTMRTPRRARPRQNSRVSAPLASQGKAVIPPVGRTQRSNSVVAREDLVEERQIRLRHLAGARIDLPAVLQGKNGEPLAEHIRGDR